MSDYDVVIGGSSPGEHCVGALVERELWRRMLVLGVHSIEDPTSPPGEAVHSAREAAAKAEVDVDAALAWRDFMVSNYSDAGQQRWLAGTDVVDVDGVRHTADHVVLANGADPIVPPVSGLRELEGIWTNREITGIWQLTHAGKYRGEVAASNILGEPREANYEAVPRVVFTDPQVAAVGATVALKSSAQSNPKEFAMNTIDTSPSNNARGSEAWSRSWTHFRVDRRSPRYCRVTFDHPPISTITATTVAALAELVSLIEQDPDFNVVVFDSVNPDFYLAHYDVENDPSRTAALGVGPTGMPAWIDVLVRLSRAPVVSIASIRGRARGAGSEFVLACDLRFASRENTLLGQFEVGIGVVPGGGPMARLSRLVGRGRALEILLVADDFDGPRAEQYGYVNRLIVDNQLDAEVEAVRLKTRAFRPRRDRAHEVVRRPGDVARRQRASARPG